MASYTSQKFDTCIIFNPEVTFHAEYFMFKIAQYFSSVLSCVYPSKTQSFLHPFGKF